MNGGIDTSYGLDFQTQYALFKIIHSLEEKKLRRFDIEHDFNREIKLPSADLYIKTLERNRENKRIEAHRIFEIKSGKNVSSKPEILKTIYNFYRIYTLKKRSVYYHLAFIKRLKNYLTILLFLKSRTKNDVYRTSKERSFDGFHKELVKFANRPGKARLKSKIRINKRNLKQLINWINFEVIDEDVSYEHETKRLIKNILSRAGLQDKIDSTDAVYNSLLKSVSNYMRERKNNSYKELFDVFLFVKDPEFAKLIEASALHPVDLIKEFTLDPYILQRVEGDF